MHRQRSPIDSAIEGLTKWLVDTPFRTTASITLFAGILIVRSLTSQEFIYSMVRTGACHRILMERSLIGKLNADQDLLQKILTRITVVGWTSKLEQISVKVSHSCGNRSDPLIFGALICPNDCFLPCQLR